MGLWWLFFYHQLVNISLQQQEKLLKAYQSEDTEDTSKSVEDLARQINRSVKFSKEMSGLSQKMVESTEQVMKEVERLRKHNTNANRINRQIQKKSIH